MENQPREITEYNDGENVTHYLGNDDYPGNNLPPRVEKHDLLEGKEALGNDLKEEEKPEEGPEEFNDPWVLVGNSLPEDAEYE